MINATLLTLAETSLNKVLLLSPETVDQLDQISNKVIAIQLTSPVVSLSLRPSTEGIQIDMLDPDNADVTLTGSASDFFRLLTAADNSDAMFGKSINVSGDSSLATRFSNVLIDAALDWEALLAQLLGDLPAHEIARYLRWKANLYLNTGNSLILNLEEYLKEELRALPSVPEISQFSSEVDRIRQATERLTARIERLKQHA